MSMVTTNRTHRRDKSNSSQKQSHASAEDVRLAQIINPNERDEDTEMHDNVAKIIEVTGTTEDNARTALYDANNDTNRAIELIIENGSVDQQSEWETAGKKKNKQTHTSVKSVDTFDDEIKDDTLPAIGNWERSTSKGRGRGKPRNRGKSNDNDRRNDEDSRGGLESRERQRGGRRGRGRGGSSRGRQPGRGQRRFPRFNQNYDEKSGKDQNNFDDKFGNFTTSNTDQTDPSKLWATEDEDWGNLEVGTWSNDDAQKNKDKVKDSFTEPWGTGSWNDDLAETKVFQSQNTQISTSSLTSPLASQQNRIQNSTTAPQMGERIDLGALFKKNHPDGGNVYTQQINSGALGQGALPFNGSNQHTTSVIQQLQQQGQSNSLFSDTKAVNDLESQSSRLFGPFERQVSSSSANNSTAVGHYSSHGSETSYSQYNGKLMADSSEGNSSSLLGSFGEQFKSAEVATSNSMLDQIPGLTKSAFTSLKQNDSQGIPPTTSAYDNFSQTQAREATEAVKASLGLPPIKAESLDQSETQTGSTSLSQADALSHSTLSFGAPQVVRQPKQQRRKPLSSKIPASAVEMPGACGGSYHELSNFDLQFGVDDNTSSTAANDFGTTNGPISTPGVPGIQNRLFNNNIISSQSSVVSNMSSGNLEESSIFSSQLASQSQQIRTSLADTSLQTPSTSTSVSLHGSQRYLESMKQNEPLRGPPGIAHPKSLSSSTTSVGGLSGSNGPPGDLSSSGGSFASSRMVAGGNISLGGLPHESTMEQTQSKMGNQSHLYYTSTSLSQQSQQQQQQQMVSDLSNSAGRSLRSPVTTSNMSGSLQASPMPHIPGTPSKDSGSSSSAMSSLTSGLAQSHITPHVGSTPTKLQTSSASAPISILGSSSSMTGGNGGYGSMNIGYNMASSGPSQPSSTPIAASPGKHLSSSDLYTSSGLSSSLHHNHQQTSSSVPNSIGSGLGSSMLPMASTSSTKASTQVSSTSKAGPPNLTLGVPPILPNQYGIPMGPGLMTAYTPEALFGYPDSLMAMQSRVHQLPNYYDMYSTGSQSANNNTLNRESSSNTASQGKFSRGEPTSPTSVIGIIGSAGSGIAQQPVATGQHSAQMKVSQTGTHQAQPYVNLPTAAPAYPGYSGLYYNAFQYPPMFAAATAVPNAKHQVNATTAFQQPGSGFGNAYSTASISVSSASNLHDLQGQGYTKSHMPAYDKQQAAFHHHTNTPPPAFNLQTLTAAMAAANTGAAGTAGAGPGMSPYTQAPFMTMLPTHQPSQIHLHLPQHGDVGQSVGSQRSQASNQMGKAANKGPFGNTTGPYWGN
ncbi:uncharacterized protein LOC143445296 isoform X1 [Clavelina lepadiformis]|uniref:uncharacterized protein LOC143445296 isoform X1 n=1 Tax=Clavelina lepadiformis TaxID=159417 RepID=UPI0040426310